MQERWMTSAANRVIAGHVGYASTLTSPRRLSGEMHKTTKPVLASFYADQSLLLFRRLPMVFMFVDPMLGVQLCAAFWTTRHCTHSF